MAATTASSGWYDVEEEMVIYDASLVWCASTLHVYCHTDSPVGLRVHVDGLHKEGEDAHLDPGESEYFRLPKSLKAVTVAPDDEGIAVAKHHTVAALVGNM